MKRKPFFLAALIGLLVLQAMVQGYGERGQGMRRRGQMGEVGENGARNGGRFNGGMNSLISSLPYEELSENEIKGLLHMREEEKLARDVYLVLYDEWGHDIFKNIAQSEQRHMDVLERLVEKYNLIDSIVDGTRGVFSNQDLQNLYDELVYLARSSFIQALNIGATIEDLDIFDLLECVHDTDNVDIQTVYQNLMKGSRNHLRTFVEQLLSFGVSYPAQYLTQEEIDKIVNSPMERGFLDQDGNPFYPRIGW